jgi:succinate-semialdehyde dehydrogenase / glutarate-semialdehyde dehydrogenase
MQEMNRTDIFYSLYLIPVHEKKTGMSEIITTNPSNGVILHRYKETGEDEVLQILEKSGRAFDRWRSLAYGERAVHFLKMSELLKGSRRELSELMATEMGKPVKEGIAEIAKCAATCEYFAQNGEYFLSPESVATEAYKSYVTFQPLGTILAIMPWNFPFWQVFRFFAPAGMAGNVAILKHSSNVTGCALAIEELFRKAGFPDGVFSSVVLRSDRISELIRHPLIKAVTLTGSSQAGRSVAAEAGRSLKKTVLELGGSDPYIILADANLEKAAEVCARSRLINNGQSCVAAKRFIAVKEVREQFEKLLVNAMQKEKYGDPMSKNTDLGPMARKDLRDQLHGQVTKSTGAGAFCLTGGYIPEEKGYFYPPTVLSNVGEGMPAFGEELFGPVASVIEAQDHEHAIELANKSNYGLGGAVFSRNIDLAESLASEKLEAGCCFVNDMVRSDPRLPFGGIKDSGYGRELSAYKDSLYSYSLINLPEWITSPLSPSIRRR